MSDTATCTNCQQTWAVVPGIRKAHPGRTSQPVSVLVPDEDVWGRTLGTARRQSSHWISDGPSATLVRVDEGGPTWADTWVCLCGAPMAYETPAWDLVACTYHAGADGVCGKRAQHLNPPSDLYVNARYGGACPCCGHQGTHHVRRDGAHAPRCLSK